MSNAIGVKSCIICESSNFEFMFSSKDRMFNLPGEFSVKKCSNCSLIFLDPQPGEQLLKKHYPSLNYYSYYRSKIKGLFKILREYLFKHYYSPNIFSLLISAFIQNVPAIPSYVKNGKILDVGCGDGDTLAQLKKLGWETYGLDIDSRAVEVASMRGINAKLGTFREISKYPDDYFDAIRLYHVIEHLDDPSLCLSLIRKKLRKNGELLIGTPNIKSIVAFLFKSYWYNLDTPRHLFLFAPATLGKLLNKNNFIVKKMEFCSVGGILGSLQYLIGDLLNKKFDLMLKTKFVLLFYPLEWFLNKIGAGDVFVVRAIAKSSPIH